MRKASLLIVLVIGLLTLSITLAMGAAGPHGNYSDVTDKCKECHDVHEAQGTLKLLMRNTVYDTCQYCHDGATAKRVYEFTYTEGASHTCETTTGSLELGIENLTTTLTCSSCHSPHDNPNRVVDVFLGDTTDTQSNRLVLRDPNPNQPVATSQTVNYGARFCADCHSRRHVTGTLANHPVDTATYYYNYVTSSAGTGNLGRTNARYKMTLTSGDDPDPICQQCHEDYRDVETAFNFNPISATYPTGVNPEYANFPHETISTRLRAETGDDLCQNCHITTELP